MKLSYRVFENTLYLDFKDEKRNDPFCGVKKRNYFQHYLKIRNHLKNVGFTIERNPFYTKDYACLAKDHLVARKDNVVILIELAPNWIQFVFSDIKNVWDDWQSAWIDSSDNRFHKLSYLEHTAVKLQIHKLKMLFETFGASITVNDNDLNPEQFILNKLRINNHIHGTVNSLDDIGKSIESGVGKYNQGSNSDDKYKRKITCGETKYFYDYSGVLRCGIVWHNINNMWWVISGNKLYNIASFGLFDYVKGLPRRNRIEKALRHEQHFASERQYLKALCVEITINDLTSKFPEGRVK